MAGKIDAFLKFSLAASVLLASASVGYYYVVYLPQRDAQFDLERKLERARADFARQTEEARSAAEKRAAEERQTAEKEAVQGRYQICVQAAERSYLAGWAAQCKRIFDKSVKDRTDCISQGQMTKPNCDFLYKSADGGPNCSLPRILGTDLDDVLEKSRNRCLQESRSGLQ